MAIEIVFEVHQLSEDNERGIATGWFHGKLSARGRAFAREMGDRRRSDGLHAVFTSDLGRAVETVNVAFEGAKVPILHDWRLRECDYGDLNGMPVEKLHAERVEHLDDPFPGGGSWRQAVERVGRFFDDLPLRWNDRPRIVFQRVSEKKVGKNRVHLDMQVGQEHAEAEVQRLRTIGATKAATVEPAGPGRHLRTIMRDPEGNEFCVQ